MLDIFPEQFSADPHAPSTLNGIDLDRFTRLIEESKEFTDFSAAAAVGANIKDKSVSPILFA